MVPNDSDPVDDRVTKYSSIAPMQFGNCQLFSHACSLFPLGFVSWCWKILFPSFYISPDILHEQCTKLEVKWRANDSPVARNCMLLGQVSLPGKLPYAYLVSAFWLLRVFYPWEFLWTVRNSFASFHFSGKFLWNFAVLWWVAKIYISQWLSQSVIV